jgi:hypothetical protein
MVPFRKPAAEIPQNKFFNYYFSTERSIIENVSGLVKNRFLKFERNTETSETRAE